MFEESWPAMADTHQSDDAHQNDTICAGENRISDIAAREKNNDARQWTRKIDMLMLRAGTSARAGDF